MSGEAASDLLFRPPRLHAGRQASPILEQAAQEQAVSQCRPTLEAQLPSHPRWTLLRELLVGVQHSASGTSIGTLGLNTLHAGSQA